MLEDRLDPRLEPGAKQPGLAERWQRVKRERDAARFDEVADQIEKGLLRVSGREPDAVVQHLRGRADGVRSGTDRLRRKAVRRSRESYDDEGE